jgi:hypothetical protein
MTSICDRIKERRNVGRTICAVFHGGEVVSRKIRLKRLGLRDIPEELWVVITRIEAINPIDA